MKGKRKKLEEQLSTTIEKFVFMAGAEMEDNGTAQKHSLRVMIAH